MRNTILEPATLKDAPALSLIVNNAYRGRDADAGWTSEVGILSGPRADAAAIEKMIAAGTATVLVLRHNDTKAVVGCVCVESLDAATWYLSMIAVDPQHQEQGLGKLIVAGAEDYVRARGARRARMTVIQVRSSLIAWYRRQGYLPTGETEQFPYGDDSVGVPLRDDLHFVVLEKTLAAA